MTDLTNLSIVQAKKLILQGEFSVTELVEAHLKKSEELKNLNAFIMLTPELALEQAKQSEYKIRNNTAGIIEGIPIAVKDIFCTKDFKTTSCSHILDNFIPQYESTVTSLLYKNGGIMIGKTNMDEFAMGGGNLNSYYGSVTSPWKRSNDSKSITPGGSSGGSAAAVAAKMCLGALGTDTGGSIRQPAAFTGIVGIKPTYGRCSRYGIISFASSLDQAGVLARNVEDAALLLQSICGYDSKDSTSMNLPTPEWSKSITNGIKGLKVGIPKEYDVDGMSEEIRKLWQHGAQWLKDAGAEIVHINLPHTKYALACYYIIAPCEASSNLARYDGIRYGLRVKSHNSNTAEMISETRAAGFGAEVKRRIMIGTYLLSADHYNTFYIKAQKMRRLLANDFKDAFNEIDMILTPTTPTPAFALDETTSDPITMYLNDIFTVTVNLAGLPAISIPSGLSSNGLPLGLQIIGKPFAEENIFKAGYVMQQAADFKGL